MKKRITIIILVMLLLFLSLVFYKQFYKMYNIGIPCLFHLITGFDCPGCGMTRAIFAIMEGNIIQAYHYNPLVFIFLPIALLYIGYKFYLYIFQKKDFVLYKIPNIFYSISLIVVIIFGITRNILR